MKNRRIALLFIILACLSILSFVGFKKFSADSHLNYKLATIKRGSIRSIVATTGTLSPLEEIIVGSQVSGVIKQVNCDYNSKVMRDQVIALIDPALYAAQTAQAEANLKVAEAELLDTQKKISGAKSNILVAQARLNSALASIKEVTSRYNRTIKLEAQEVVPKSVMDAITAERSVSMSSVEIARAQLYAAEAGLKRAQVQETGAKAIVAQKEASLNFSKTQLSYCTIRSPIDGIIISKHINIGQTVASSFQSPILFTIAEDLSKMQLEIYVDESEVGRIEIGQKIDFRVDAFPDRVFETEVTQIRNASKKMQNVVIFTVVANIKNENLLLRPGMTANVNIVTSEIHNSLKAPNSAFRFKLPNDKGSNGNKKVLQIKERPEFKWAVDKLNLSQQQIEKYVKIIEQMYKAYYIDKKHNGNAREIYKQFIIETNQKLFLILNDNQRKEKFGLYVEAIKSFYKRKEEYKEETIYVLDKKGKAESKKVFVGITDEIDTQIISDQLKEGDKIVIGISATSNRNKKANKSLFSSIIK